MCFRVRFAQETLKNGLNTSKVLQKTQIIKTLLTLKSIR